MNKKTLLALAILSIILVSGCAQQGQTNEQGVTIVNGASGQAKIDGRCADETYVNEISDYVIKGAVSKVESRWNSDKTSISTYTDIKIDEYTKGEPLKSNKLQIVTPGGCVDGVCLSAEDHPAFIEGDYVRVRFSKSGNEYAVVCGANGVSKQNDLEQQNLQGNSESTATQKYPVIETNTGNFEAPASVITYNSGGNAMRLEGWEKEVDEQADFVFTGRVSDVSTKAIESSAGSVIYTYVTIPLDRVEKDNISSVIKTSPMVLAMPGGCANGICMSSGDEIEFTPGQYVRVYLEYVEAERKFNVLYAGEASNYSITTPPVIYTAVDLSLERLDIVPSNPSVNQATTFNFTIKNNGNIGCSKINLIADTGDNLGVNVASIWCRHYEKLGMVPKGTCTLEATQGHPDFGPGDTTYMYFARSYNSTGSYNLTAEIFCDLESEDNYADNSIARTFTVQ